MNFTLETLKASKVGQSKANARVLAELQMPKRERNQIAALDGDAPTEQRSCARLAISIIGCRKRLLDSDNFTAGNKHLRDCISRSLNRDDGDPAIEWHYHQVKSPYEGTIVRIDVL